MSGGFAWSIREGVGVVSLARPPRNSLDSGLFAGLAALVDLLASGKIPPDSQSVDTALRGLVIHGQGKHFSAGADLDELGRLLRGAAAEPEFLRRNSRALDGLGRLPFPTVAAIGGCCLGAGLELALACRHRIASDNAMLAFPESGFGIIPGCGGTVRTAGLLSPGKAIELVLGGRNLLADEALRLGLVDCVVERGRLMDSAFALIDRLAPVILRQAGGDQP